MTTFRTHTGEIVQGERLQDALDSVANDWRQLAYDIKRENAYTSHVTEEAKVDFLNCDLITADRIQRGEESGFWLWQRINSKLTGECIALLPK